MPVIMIFCGAAVGIIQFFLLKSITERILILNKNPVFPLILKIIIYAASAVLLLTVLQTQIIYIGIGFGGGITITSFIYFAIILCRNNKSIGKEEK